jgi:cellulose synthase/poly-beta-1,6-N-acetylglucosamine synthase-like glycosyltransferase
MTTFLATLYWVTLGLALYGFLGYPLLMLVVRAIRGRLAAEKLSDDQLPTVTLIVAAHNEEKNITATLRSLLAQRYPHEKMTIAVFSDGSTDRTERIVSTFKDDGVLLVTFERLGKTECQNRMAEQTTAEILGFVDGNVAWEPDALRALVAPFADRRVAATTGALRLLQKNREEKVNEGLFRRLDHIVKVGESRLFSAIGVNGPIYAVRRTDYARLRPDLVSDLVLPVLLAAQGKKVLYVPEAVALEPASETIWQEFKRKRRLVTQGLVAIPYLLKAAHPLRQPLLFFMLFSHKLLRWFGIELLMIAFLVSLFLIGSPFFSVLVIVEVILLVLAGIGIVLRNRVPVPLLQALSYFVLTNIAGLLGGIDAVRGQRAAVWKTQRP